MYVMVKTSLTLSIEHEVKQKILELYNKKVSNITEEFYKDIIKREEKKNNGTFIKKENQI